MGNRARGLSGHDSTARVTRRPLTKARPRADRFRRRPLAINDPRPGAPKGRGDLLPFGEPDHPYGRGVAALAT